MIKTVLITGSSGLLGANLVDALLRKGYRVIGYSKSYQLKTFELLQFDDSNYIPVEGDISDYQHVEYTIKQYQPNFIIHLAAQAIVGTALSSPLSTYETNIKGIWNLLECIKDNKNIERIIIASTDKVYGEPEELPYKENSPLNAKYPYDLSKKISEEIAFSYYQRYNIPLTITRCGNIFGKYDLNFSRIIPYAVVSLLKDKDIVIRSDGKQRRCFIFIDDVVDAYLSLLESPAQKVIGQAFNIGTLGNYSVLEIIEKIEKILDKKSNIIIQNSIKGEISEQSLDYSKIKENIGWSPKIPFEIGLKEMITWYKEHLNKM